MFQAGVLGAYKILYLAYLIDGVNAAMVWIKLVFAMILGKREKLDDAEPQGVREAANNTVT